MSDGDKIKEAFNNILVATAQLAHNLQASASSNVYPPALGESGVALDKSLRSFHTALDMVEISLVQARDTLQRDLNQLQQPKQPRSIKTENGSAESHSLTIDIE
ncbi:hypothetical protein V1525DRAFT_421904 [Lipomyces kononenkoae]|uniref:Uncharacterized protein n=1 Tax=Lipomyces kononenkoae TaxID=34357 RepID=A0ACC3ST64_LIPKO